MQNSLQLYRRGQTQVKYLPQILFKNNNNLQSFIFKMVANDYVFYSNTTTNIVAFVQVPRLKVSNIKADNSNFRQKISVKAISKN